jgi:hypothetical protein
MQTGMPMTALSVVGASWRLKPADRGRLVSELLPWALQAGSRSADLMCLYYEKHFEVRALRAVLPHGCALSCMTRCLRLRFAGAQRSGALECKSACRPSCLP